MLICFFDRAPPILTSSALTILHEAFQSPSNSMSAPSKIHHVRLLLFQFSLYCFGVVDVSLVEQAGFAPASVNLSLRFNECGIYMVSSSKTILSSMFATGMHLKFAPASVSAG